MRKQKAKSGKQNWSGNFILLFSYSIMLLFSYSVSAQTVTISGKVIDGYTQRPISSVSVISNKQNVSYLTDNDGFFSFKTDKNDTLFLFFPGYRTVRFSVADSVLKPSYFFTFYYAPLSATVSNPVIIRPKKTLSEIEKERKTLGSVPKEIAKPDWGAEASNMSVFTMLYDLVSNRAKQNKKLRGQYVEDERRRIYKELFDYFKEKKLIDLPEAYYDEFIDYMNLPLSFLQQSSDYEITETIVSNYKRFGVSRGFVK